MLSCDRLRSAIDSILNYDVSVTESDGGAATSAVQRLWKIEKRERGREKKIHETAR
jgi:hypothetical protein